MRKFWATAAMSAMTLLTCAFSLAQTTTATTAIASIGKEQVGKSVCIEGQVTGFRASRSERAPNSIYMQDASGGIRVCVWPNVYSKLEPKISDQIRTTGTKVLLTAEVAEFRNKVELHLKDAEEVEAGKAGGN